jgi:predicted O-methyltransferase YrrM
VRFSLPTASAQHWRARHHRTNERTAIVSEFLTHLRDEAAFETYLLPIGEGVAVAYRLE